MDSPELWDNSLNTNVIHVSQYIIIIYCIYCTCSLYMQSYMKIHVYSTLARLVVKEEKKTQTRNTTIQTIQTCEHKTKRTPGSPALRTGMVGSCTCTYSYMYIVPGLCSGVAGELNPPGLD